MKISVLTHWWSFENYGQMLQAYALQSILERQGHSVEQIRYCGRPRGGALLLLRLNPLHYVSAFFNRLKKPYDSHAQERCFGDFKREHLHLSDKEFFSHQDLLQDPPLSDVYIVGSDQVWNGIKCNAYARPWFLDFGSTSVKRIAYAASFGNGERSAKFLRFMKPLLQCFDAVSVREENGVTLCSQVGRDDAVHVLDPTLLLTAEDYMSITAPQTLSERSGIMGYFLGAEMDIPWEQIEDYQKDIGGELKITEISRGCEYIPKKYNFYYPTIPEWLRDISQSHLFITNSFHGTVFALIMHTPFVVFPRKDKSADINNRIYSLLGSLNLQDRVYYGGNFRELASRPINWNAVDKFILSFRNYSLSFLQEAGILGN